jgi:phage/plasmid-associated DNA primase
MMDLITTEKLENLNKDFVNSVFLGKRISWQTEVNSSRKLLDQIKDVTGGTTIQVRRKFVNGELQYPLQMVCIIDTNSPPHFDDSAAINDRMRFINMPHQFVYELSGAPNEMLIDATLVNGWKEELPAFLNLLLPYAKFFLENGRLMHDITGTATQLRERTDLISSFIEEFCDAEDEGRRVSMKKFYSYFSEFAKKMNVAVPEMSQVSFKLRKDYGLRVKAGTIYGLYIKEQKNLPVE